eukprot:7937124-Pyramimonas_sp.AAC.1
MAMTRAPRMRMAIITMTASSYKLAGYIVGRTSQRIARNHHPQRARLICVPLAVSSKPNRPTARERGNREIKVSGPGSTAPA